MADGFTQSGLARWRGRLVHHVESGAIPGLVGLIARGDNVHVFAGGVLAVGGKAPMQRDTIFRVASMTKPVLAALAMTFVEDCSLRLDEPVDRWLPEMANRRVLRSLKSPVDDTVPADRAITLRDLLTFRLGYGGLFAMPGTYPIQAELEGAGVAIGPAQPEMGPDDFMRRLGSMPLLHQPGQGWHYHTGADVLGVLLARVAGKSLGETMRERLFDPLGMSDSGFHVAEAKIDRLATSYRRDPETNRLAVWDEAAGGLWSKPRVFEAGGSGLASTASDYLAFGRMMLNKGRAGTHQVLSPASVALMTNDQLTAQQRAGASLFFGESTSWGFGMSVVIKQTELWETPGRFGWDGGYGTSFHVDPANDVVGVLLTQRMMDSPIPPAVFTDFWTTTYAALEA